ASRRAPPRWPPRAIDLGESLQSRAPRGPVARVPDAPSGPGRAAARQLEPGRRAEVFGESLRARAALSLGPRWRRRPELRTARRRSPYRPRRDADRPCAEASSLSRARSIDEAAYADRG